MEGSVSSKRSVQAVLLSWMQRGLASPINRQDYVQLAADSLLVGTCSFSSSLILQQGKHVLMGNSYWNVGPLHVKLLSLDSHHGILQHDQLLEVNP